MPQRFPHSLLVAIVFAAGLACAAVTILDAYVAGFVSARVAYSGAIALALLLTGITGLIRPNIFRPIAVNLTLLAAGLLALQSLLVPSRYVAGSKAYEIWRRGGPDAGTYPTAGPYNFLATEVGVDDLSSLLPGGHDQPLPLGGPAHARLVVCNEDEGWFTFQSDRYGFNNPDDVYDRLAAERPIVFIGDSFVEGACTNGYFVDRLRRSLPVPLVNLGKGGNGPLAELATLREFGLGLRPRTLVWVYFAGNDLGQPWASPRQPDLARELKSPLLRPYLDDATFSQNLRARATTVDTNLKEALSRETVAQRELPAPLAGFRQAGHVATSQGLVLYALDLLTGERTSTPVNPAVTPGETENLLAVFDAIMHQVRDAADRDDFKVVFVLLPDKVSCRKQKPHELDPAVKHIASNLRFEIVDLFDDFGADQCRAQLFAKGGPHLTAEGNKVVAQALEAVLR